MANPKLALIPSGYNVAEVYSVLPSDGTADFLFDRTGSATRVREDGLIETVLNDVPRLDWLNSNCPNLLLEAQSTNNHTYSESKLNKSHTGVTLTDNQAVSPSGEYNAMEVKEDTSTGRHKFSTNSFSIINSVTYTLSMFVKKNSDNRFIFINAGVALGVSGSFNLDTQAVTGGVKIINNYGNDWYRIGITATASSTQSEVIFIQMQEGIIDDAYTGDESSVFVWGLQFEQSAGLANLATSYIPNLATGSTTRQSETCSVTTPSGVSQIVETFSENTTNTITTIPTTYNVSNGRIKKVIMT